MRIIRPRFNDRMSQLIAKLDREKPPFDVPAAQRLLKLLWREIQPLRNDRDSAFRELRDWQHHVQATLAIGEVQGPDRAQQFFDVRPALPEGSENLERDDLGLR